jgi:tetratricopeptide (TPR) repeat protein
MEICKQIEDVHGEAVACNCLGVDHMLLAWTPSDEGFIGGFKPSPENFANIDKAITYHQQHVNIADQGGKFVAHINLGLCFGVKGEHTIAAKHYQNALRIAIKMQTLFGQSLAVGNLGMLAFTKGDYQTSRTCFEQVCWLMSSFIFYLFKYGIHHSIFNWFNLSRMCKVRSMLGSW